MVHAVCLLRIRSGHEWSNWYCRSLGLNLNDDEDDADDNQHGAQATAFAFGAAHAWERFTVPCISSEF